MAIAETVKRRQFKREVITLAGFGALFVGVAGACGIWHALMVGGGIVLLVGLYGMSRG